MVKNTLFPFLFTLFALCCSNRSIGQGQCDYYSVKFSNVTNKEIHLAVSYIPLEKEISSNSFESKAWYILQPGETKLIFNTKCLTFYYYADTPFDENGKRLEWKGGDKI